MDLFTDAHQWAQYHFADADLGDRRRTRRLVQAAADIATHPQQSFTQVFDWNDLRAFYRLCDDDAASHHAIRQRTGNAHAKPSPTSPWCSSSTTPPNWTSPTIPL